MPIQIESLQKFSGSKKTSDNPIVGIDLGTTHSLVAVVTRGSQGESNGQPRILKTKGGGNLLPSVVSLQGERPVVGEEAKRNKVRKARGTVFSVKRWMGKGAKDLQSLTDALPYEVLPGEHSVQIKIGEKTYTPVEISSWILRELKLSAEAELGCAVTRAVITVPAYFNDAQRQATRTAGRLAGLDVLRIINEPTAASLAYGLDRKKQGLIAVYDLGGGTFDISILKLHDGIFEVLATNGDTQLGGDDLDQAMAQVAATEIEKEFGIKAQEDVQLWAALLEASESAKIALSEQDKAEVSVLLPAPAVGTRQYHKTWTRAEFEALVAPILERTRQPCEKALKDAGLRASDLSDVILVGGPTRLACVQKQVEKIFEKKPNTSVHPDEVVAAGAAIQADILAGNNQDLLLLDVVPLSLGLETYGGLMSALISRNTRIPAVAKEVFTTFVDNQTGVDIQVLQGEREKAAENRSLAKFTLKGIQPMPAGMPRVEVTFLIDADGILQVAAKDLRTGKEQSIEVRPTYGLTDAEVEKMLAERLEHQSEDRNYKKLVDARNEAERVMRAVEKALPLGNQVLPAAEMAEIQKTLKTVKDYFEGSDPGQLRQATDELNRVTANLAGKVIQNTLKD